MRHKPRLDANQAAIVAGLRAVGATVQSLASIGQGCPDLLVGFRGRNVLFEVKRPGAQLTPAEAHWFDGWRGERRIVTTLDEAWAVLIGRG
jgi:hypothetical protein